MCIIITSTHKLVFPQIQNEDIFLDFSLNKLNNQQAANFLYVYSDSKFSSNYQDEITVSAIDLCLNEPLQLKILSR